METKRFGNLVPGGDDTQPSDAGLPPQASGKKVSLVEGILMIGFCIFFDILDVILDLLVVGLFVNSIIDVFTTSVIRFWSAIKGIRGTFTLIGGMIEFIPVINALPIRTATMIMTIYVANKPVVAKVINAKNQIRSAGAGAKDFRANMKERGFGGALKDQLRGTTPGAPKETIIARSEGPASA